MMMVSTSNKQGGVVAGPPAVSAEQFTLGLCTGSSDGCIAATNRGGQC